MAFGELSHLAKRFKLGRYRHFKGGEYEAVALAYHSETGEEMVVYREENSGKSSMLHVRPLAMFVEDVLRDGVRKPRFMYLGPSETNPVGHGISLEERDE